MRFTDSAKKQKMSETLTLVLSKEKDFKVADMSLAEWGRKEIMLAEYEMPGK